MHSSLGLGCLRSPLARLHQIPEDAREGLVQALIYHPVNKLLSLLLLWAHVDMLRCSRRPVLVCSLLLPILLLICLALHCGVA